MNSRNAFFYSLAFVTLIPLIGIPIADLAGVPGSFYRTHPFYLVILLTFSGHVASTAYFYVDRDFWSLIERNWPRFVLAPLALMAGFLVAYQLGTRINAFALLSYFCWQLFHYQKQNYGLISFAASSEGAGPPPKILRLGLNLGVVAGVLGAIGYFSAQGRDLLGFTDAQLKNVSRGLHLPILACFAWLIVYHRKFLAHRFTCLFTVASLLFFLPAALGTNGLVAFATYAIAHGAQYLIFMGVLAKRSNRFYALPALGALTIGLMIILLLMQNDPYLEHMGLGVVCAHFVVDAKVWRLREPEQRKLIGERFGFLFPQRAGSTR